MLSLEEIDVKIKKKTVGESDLAFLSNEEPTDEILIRLATIYKDLEKFKNLDKSIDCYTRIKKLDVWGRIGYADALIRTQKPDNIDKGIMELESIDNPNAQIFLAKQYASGKYLPEDLNKAIECAEKASAENGWAVYLKTDYLVKRGRPEDFEEAVALLKDRDSTDSSNRLCKIYLDKRYSGNSLNKSLCVLAHEYKTRGKLLSLLVQVLIAQKTAFHRDLAVAILETESEKGNTWAMNRLAQMYKYGVDAPYSSTKAEKWIKKAVKTEPMNEDLAAEYASIVMNHVQRESSYRELVDYLKEKDFDNKTVVMSRIQACIYLSDTRGAEEALEAAKGYSFYNVAKESLRAVSCSENESDLKLLDILRTPLKRQSEERDICVMYAVDDSYARFIPTSIQSVIANSNGRRVRIFIATTGLSERTRELLYNLDAEIAIIDVDPSIFEDLEITMDSYYNKIKYASAFPQTIVPDDVRYLLYLGADTVVDGDITELFDADMGDKAAFVITTVAEADKLLDSKGNGKGSVHGCFYLYNMERIRAINPTVQKFLDMNYPAWTEEQYLAQFYGENRLTFIDFLRFGYRRGYTSLFNNRKMDYLLPKPVTLHFVGKPKPWSFYYNEVEEVPPFITLRMNNGFNDIWWKYAKQMPAEVYDDVYLGMKNARAVMEYMVKRQYVQDRTSGRINAQRVREAYDAGGLTPGMVSGFSYKDLGVDLIYYSYLFKPELLKGLKVSDIQEEDKALAGILEGYSKIGIGGKPSNDVRCILDDLEGFFESLNGCQS